MRITVDIQLAILALVIVLTGYDVSAQSIGAPITGRVIFQGPIPPPNELKVNIDQGFCGTTITHQPLQTQQGSVRDAVVSIEGLTAEVTTDTTSQAVHILTNRQCVFRSRIGIAQVGDQIEIRNDDPLMHNTHIRLGETTMVNVVIVKNGRPIRKTIQTPGMLEVKCDKHKFMQGYVLAFAHPYVSVTDTTGHFEISHVPAGLHTLRVWHETLGVLETDIEVPTTGDVTIDIKYPHSSTSQ